jgi:hypothetical protein
MVSIVGCYPPSNPPPIMTVVDKSPLCALKPIRVRKGDILTLDTADEILRYNQRGQRECGWTP